MPGSTLTDYTALHGSLAVCEWCGSAFEPRIRAGPNRDRFCQPSHKDHWWNRRRRESTVAQGESKLHRVLAALASGRSLNRYEALHGLGDCVLNTTVSEIQRRLGIRVSRRRENRLARYWLEPADREKAGELLANAQKFPVGSMPNKDKLSRQSGELKKSK